MIIRLKKSFFYLSASICCIANTYAQYTEIWKEDFPVNNATSDAGATAWTTSGTPTGFFKVFNNALVANNAGGFVTWTSEDIDISSYTDVKVMLDARYFDNGDGILEISDSLKAYYRINGGSYLPMENGLQAALNDYPSPYIRKAFIGGLNGNTLTIKVLMNNDEGDEFMGIDNVIVFEEPDTLYSRGNSNWQDNTNWSYSDGGASCNCRPTVFSNTIIKSGHIVTLNTSTVHYSRTIDVSGSLKTTTGAEVSMYNSKINVNPGGSWAISSGTSTIISWGTTDSISVNGTGVGDLDNIIVENKATLNLSGSAAVIIYDLDIKGNNATLTTDATGTSTVVGDIDLEGNNAQLIINSGASLKTNADIDVVTSLNSGRVVKNYGNLEFDNINARNADIHITNYNLQIQNGNFINVGGTADSFFNATNATWKLASTAFTSSIFFDASAVNNTVVYFTSVNVDVYNPPGGYWNLELANGGNNIARQNIIVNGNLIIGLNDTLDLNVYNRNLTIKGNIIDSGSIEQDGTATRITLSGSTEQRLTKINNPFNFKRLWIENTSATGIVIDTIVEINNVLTLKDGYIITSNEDFVFLTTTNAKIDSASDASYIDGKMSQHFSSADGIGVASYSLGKDGHLAKAEVSKTIGGFAGSLDIAISYIDSGFNTTIIESGDSIEYVSNVGYWDVEPSNPNINTNISFHWSDTSYFGINDTDDLEMAHWNGSAWESVAPIEKSKTGKTGYITINASDFSPFAFASKTVNIGINPLPIELINFYAELTNDVVELQWEVAMENENDYFTIQRSEDAIYFEDVVKVYSLGNTNENRIYVATDENPLQGISYYRLKQTDFDKTASYSALKVINNNSLSSFKETINVFPNPIAGNEFYIQITDAIEMATSPSVELLDMSGRQINNISTQLLKNNGFIYVYLYNDLPTGIYSLSVSTDQNKWIKRITIIK